MEQGARVAGYVIIIDGGGLRHAIRAISAAALSNADPAQDETILQLGASRSFKCQLHWTKCWIGSAWDPHDEPGEIRSHCLGKAAT